VLSEQERAEWQAFHPQGRFEVVANPFVPQSPDTSARPDQAGEGRAARPAATRLLFVGRLIPEKGIFDVLEALAMQKGKSLCSLVVAGEGPAAEAVRSRITRLGLGQRVELRGYLGPNQLAEAYGSADVLVLPTYHPEGFPTVILEAMYSGLAVVTTPVRGAADRLVDGVNALFVPPRRPDVLAGALGRLADDPGLREEMGRNNRRKVQEFTPERVAPSYLAILMSVAAGDLEAATRRAGEGIPS